MDEEESANRETFLEKIYEMFENHDFYRAVNFIADCELFAEIDWTKLEPYNVFDIARNNMDGTYCREKDTISTLIGPKCESFISQLIK